MPECLRFDLVGESEEVVCGAAKLEAGLAQEVCAWRSQSHLPVAHGLVRHAYGRAELHLREAAQGPRPRDALAYELVLVHDASIPGRKGRDLPDGRNRWGGRAWWRGGCGSGHPHVQV